MELFKDFEIIIFKETGKHSLTGLGKIVTVLLQLGEYWHG